MNAVKVNGFEIRPIVMGVEPETYVLNIFGDTEGIAEDMKQFGAVTEKSDALTIIISASNRSDANAIRNRIIKQLTPEAAEETAI